MSGHEALRHAGRTLAAALLATALAGCFNPFSPRVLRGRGISEPPPAPDSPGNVLRLLRWCYVHRAIAEYRELFTEDYRFVFSQLDPEGNAYRDQNPWTREDEIESTKHLFQGGAANQPAASTIRLDLDPNFTVTDDPRFPGEGRTRKQIGTQVLLSIVDVNQAETSVTGRAVFSLARGDVALVPEELAKRGFGPDSTRWYIERHEDLTLQPSSVASAATTPPPPGLAAHGAPRASPASQHLSWGRLKAFYR